MYRNFTTMVLPSDRERIKTLLIETITLLCKNGLNFQFEFSVEALIGITIDQSDVFLINIQETVKSGQGNEEGECQGEAQNDSSTEQFSDTSLPPSIQNADYQQTVVSLQSLSRRNVITDMLSAEGNTDAFGKLQAVSGASRRKSKMNAVSKNYHHVLSPSKSEGCLPEIPLSSPSAGDDVICDLENVFPNVPSQKNSEISTESLTFTNQEPPRKRRCGVSPSSRVAEDGHGSRETNIEDLITQCKTEPLDVIKLEESPIDSSAVESPNRQENSSFLYNSTYSNDISYTNWYGQENLVNPSAIPGCSTWPNPSTHNASAKHLPDQMVELVPGSGVYISASLFDEIEQEPNLKGSRLVRRLVYDIFPDEQLLAMSSCLGKGHQSSRQGLDQNKVDAIKAFVMYKCPMMKERDIVQTINWICGNTRKRLRDRVKRLSQECAG